VRSRTLWPFILIGVAAVVGVILAALPASIVTHFLPPGVRAEDFSGSIWHGSAGRLRVNARDAGALEWRLHAAPLLGMTVSAELHWVKVGFVVDGAVDVDRHGVAARDVKGGGPIEDLRELGVAAGWRGMANINLSELHADFAGLKSAAGDIQVANLTATQMAGANLGGYELRLPGAVGPDGNLTAELTDLGGPLEVRATVHYSAKDHTGILSGTLLERPDAPAELRDQLQNFVQLRGRDPQGRIPVDLEFVL